MSNLSPAHNCSFEAGYTDGFYDKKPADYFNYQYMQGWKVGRDDYWEEIRQRVRRCSHD